MKYLSNDRGVLSVLVAVLVVALVAVLGVAIYSANKSHQKNAQTTSASPSPATSQASTATPVATLTPTPAPTDQDLITAAVKTDIAKRGSVPPSGSKVILRKLQDNYSKVDVSLSNGPGYFELLKKSGGTWTVAFQGQNIDPSTEAQLGFPQGFTNTGSFQSTVLFTY